MNKVKTKKLDKRSDFNLNKALREKNKKIKTKKFKKNFSPDINPKEVRVSLKKQLGQHFLKDPKVTGAMLSIVDLSEDTNIFEIGCGSGFLTKEILKKEFKRLWVFEIDSYWANFVKDKYKDKRLKIFNIDILDFDFSLFEPGPWTILANIPYGITFPILKRLFNHRHLISEGVIMLQEEVAQKLKAKIGKATFQSLFFGNYFKFELFLKVTPESFYPQPKINSRLLYLAPQRKPKKIEKEKKFWNFVKICFNQRRRTLKNNLKQSHFETKDIPEKYLKSRAQELSLENFLEIWKIINS